MTTIDGSNSLADLAGRIQTEHKNCTAALARGLRHAVTAGLLLLEAKALLKHGEWLPWLKQHCGIPERTARRYMEMAPYAAIEGDSDLAISAKLADFTADADAALTFEQDPEAYLLRMINGPFSADDLDDDHPLENLYMTKLMHQANVPPLISVLLTDDDQHELHLLRLCGIKELEAAAMALAPIAKGDRALKIRAATAEQLHGGAVMMRTIAMWLLGAVLNEYERRCAASYTEEKFRQQWQETHAAWIVRLEARLADAQRKRAEAHR